MTLTAHQLEALEALFDEPRLTLPMGTGARARVHPSTGHALARRGLARVSYFRPTTMLRITAEGIAALKAHAQDVDTHPMTTTEYPWTVQRGTLLISHRDEGDALATAARLVALGHSVRVYDRADPENTTTNLRPLELTS